MMKLFVLTLLLTAFSAAPSWAARMSKYYVEQHCEQNQAQPPGAGLQYNGDPAHQSVLAMEDGDYNYPGGVEVEIFRSGAFIVEFPDNTPVVYGSNSNLDMVDDNKIGGCNREQLSEILRVNGVLPKYEEEDKEAQAPIRYEQ